MITWFKNKVAALGHCLVRWGQSPAYVVIYDDPEAVGMDGEQYYGFFESTDEALEQFDQLQGGRTRYIDPMLCMVMGPITEANDA